MVVLNAQVGDTSMSDCRVTCTRFMVTIRLSGLLGWDVKELYLASPSDVRQ